MRTIHRTVIAVLFMAVLVLCVGCGGASCRLSAELSGIGAESAGEVRGAGREGNEVRGRGQSGGTMRGKVF